MSTETETRAEYPEHEKLMAVKDESEAIGAFLEGCGYTLCEIMYLAPLDGIGALSREPAKGQEDTGRYVAVGKSTNAILADYFGIDPQKLEAEKRAMLDSLRAVGP